MIGESKALEGYPPQGDDVELMASLEKKEKENAIRGLHDAINEGHRIGNRKKPLDAQGIKYIHRLLLHRRDDKAGQFRQKDVSITEAGFTPPSWEKLPEKMTDYAEQLQGKIGEVDPNDIPSVIQLSAWAHYEFARLHPFSDGNGRVARILSDIVLERFGLYPIDEWIGDRWYKTKRADYIGAMAKVGNLRDFQEENGGIGNGQRAYLAPLEKYLARLLMAKYLSVENTFKQKKVDSVVLQAVRGVKRELKPLT